MTQTENFPIDLPLSAVSSSPEETFALGRSLGSLLQEGSIVALKGVLGSGKTCMVKGIAAVLFIEEEVTSPTYTIVSEYQGFIQTENNNGKKHPVNFFHIDAYRLNGNDDFSEIGGEEIVFGDGISVIEWCERIPAFIPSEAIIVDIQMAKDEKRLIRVYRGLLPPNNAEKNPDKE